MEKYLRYAGRFTQMMTQDKQCETDNALTKEYVIAYKTHVATRYTAAGANGMLAAVNSFLVFLGRGDLRVAPLKVQRRLLLPSEKELRRSDFARLAETAERMGKTRVALVMRTMLATGIRVGELKFITVEAAKTGHTEIRHKGKTREIFLPKKLCKLLLGYAKKLEITGGTVFVTRTAKPIDRFSVWRGMKQIGKLAGVAATKVFPHNLRRLFARTFFAKFPNIAELADIMGHSDVNTTRIYTATTGAEFREHLEALNLLL
jgi:integrase